MRKNQQKDVSYIALYVWLSIALVLSVTAICMHVSKTIVTNESLVLFFIGVLATFIVIGNQIQTYKMERRISEMVSTIKQMEEQQKNTQKQLLSTAKNTILSIVHLQLKMQSKHYDNAFLYALDLLPILPKLYGDSSFEADCVGEHLEDCIAVFNKIITDSNKATSHKISQQSFKRAFDEINQWLPDTYQKRDEVAKLKSIIKNESLTKDNKLWQ